MSKKTKRKGRMLTYEECRVLEGIFEQLGQRSIKSIIIALMRNYWDYNNGER